MTGTCAAWLLALGYLWLTTVAGLRAQITPILRSDIRAATAPNYGCDSWTRSFEGRYYTETRMPGGSPSGNDSIRLTGIRTDVLGDFGIGCRFTTSLPSSPAQGSTRYARWRIKYRSPVNWRSDSCAAPPCRSANNRTSPDKLFILGNLCDSAAHLPTRMIFHQYAAGPRRDRPVYRFTQGTGQGGAPVWAEVPVDTWLHVQVKVTSSSTLAASDGRTDVYVNNNNEAKPNKSETRLRVKTSGWGRDTCADSEIVWGDGSFNTLTSADPTANADYEIADFEYDDAFDPNWSLGSSSPKPRRLPLFGPGEH